MLLVITHQSTKVANYECSAIYLKEHKDLKKKCVIWFYPTLYKLPLTTTINN